ncbi:MAG: serine hydrolase domain-containing protein, partial [Balneolaceae bacterium]|nr:serine hydrolase domain-containing protein [Balneolaceae bacterium]
MNDFMNIATAFAIVIVYTLSLHAQVAAQPPSLDSETGRVHRIDGVIERHMQQNHIPGAVALILKDGEVAYEKAFGFSNIEDGKRMTVDTIFRIASQSKAITSVAAMILLEEGQFLLDEPVSKYLPAFKHPRVLDSYNVQTSKYSTV